MTGPRHAPWLRNVALLLLITLAAVMIHGYHPAAEDGAIYLPGIKKGLNPSLYPFGAQFFMSHADMTLFDELVAGSIRITHLPFDAAIFLWHFASIFVFLLACWRLSRLCFDDSRAHWGSVLLIASLLALPVTGTALFIMDQYLTTRSLSTPGIMFMLVSAMEKRYVRAAMWAVFTALMHPLMVVFGVAYLFFAFVTARRATVTAPLRQQAAAGYTALLLMPAWQFLKPASETYRQALNTRSYFFILRWQWYEWLGIFAPMILLWVVARYARSRQLRKLEVLCGASVAFALFFFVVALIITIPPRFASLALLQPLRSLHLVYIILFVVAGGLLGQSVLKNHGLRWLVLFLPLCGAMFYVSRQLFPADAQVEWPGAKPVNPWLQAFTWARQNTPIDAVFALDPDHMSLRGEDHQGFRAVAERSMLADAVKDSGVVTMFPALAEEWKAQVTAESGWKTFQVADFERLRSQYGVTWVVLQQPGVSGLNCPYQNSSVQVCWIPAPPALARAASRN